jgi:hypothetical protein
MTICYCFGKHASNAVFQGQIRDTWRRATREPPVANLVTFYERRFLLELAITVTLLSKPFHGKGKSSSRSLSEISSKPTTSQWCVMTVP